MGRFRQKYYDLFAALYDRFVALHASDHQQRARHLLAEKTGAGADAKVLDLCTGTGAVLLHHQMGLGKGGMCVGVDFSAGMLNVAKEKTKAYPSIFLVQADAGYLPFKNRAFDAVTCSHAFYELKGETRDRSLHEIKRVLKKGKPFLMMEHDLPANRVVRALFYVRLLSMGAGKALEILKHEGEVLGRYFDSVYKVNAPGGKSKIWICKNNT